MSSGTTLAYSMRVLLARYWGIGVLGYFLGVRMRGDGSQEGVKMVISITTVNIEACHNGHYDLT